MPTIAASTATACGPTARAAGDPCATSTSSPSPAPTRSTATYGAPGPGLASGPTSATSKSLVPVMVASFIEATALPTTRASCKSVHSLPGRRIRGHRCDHLLGDPLGDLGLSVSPGYEQAAEEPGAGDAHQLHPGRLLDFVCNQIHVRGGRHLGHVEGVAR